MQRHTSGLDGELLVFDIQTGRRVANLAPFIQYIQPETAGYRAGDRSQAAVNMNDAG
jgi:hypothetical protein